MISHYMPDWGVRDRICGVRGSAFAGIELWVRVSGGVSPWYPEVQSRLQHDITHVERIGREITGLLGTQFQREHR